MAYAPEDRLPRVAGAFFTIVLSLKFYWQALDQCHYYPAFDISRSRAWLASYRILFSLCRFAVAMLNGDFTWSIFDFIG
jgi:hypothetical protein